MGKDNIEARLLNPKLDRVFGAFGNRYRRLILFMLWKHNGQLQVSDVMLRGGAGESRERQVELRHIHLPKLEEIGYLEWNRETGAIVSGPNFDEIQPLFELIVDFSEELP